MLLATLYAIPQIRVLIAILAAILCILTLEIIANGFNKESVKAIAPTGIICSIVALVVLLTN
jgi:hypothetical protein